MKCSKMLHLHLIAPPSMLLFCGSICFFLMSSRYLIQSILCW
jgi:hypothetical protein